MSIPTTVAEGVVVGLDYTLRLDSGEVVDSSEEGSPLFYLHGHGQIIPGLERELMGLTVGDEKEVTVAATDAYGEIDEDGFQMVPLDIFPDDLELEPGMLLHLRDAQTDEPIDAIVDEILPEGVILDFNHPLAGETLYFKVKISALRAATTEELDHGHAH
jgi:FKBP-type peptidyl-prolyl cis-trans isomerase SlyD